MTRTHHPCWCTVVGGTMVACLNDLVSRGADPVNIRVVCVVTCPVALSKISDKFPGATVSVFAGLLPTIQAHCRRRAFHPAYLL